MFFFFFFSPGEQIFSVFFAPSPEEKISDYLAQGWFIRALTVFGGGNGGMNEAVVRTERQVMEQKHRGPVGLSGTKKVSV